MLNQDHKIHWNVHIMHLKMHIDDKKIFYVVLLKSALFVNEHSSPPNFHGIA